VRKGEHTTSVFATAGLTEDHWTAN